MVNQRLLGGSLVFALLATWSTVAAADVVWTGDFETGDTSQWNYVLNGTNINLIDSPVAEGAHAAEITLTESATWSNGLHRVELQHLPAASRTAEGAETFFAWSFYLPAPLPSDPNQQIGYWESQNSYKQMMNFTVTGESIRFITQQPTYQNHWEEDGLVTARTWHRIAMRILWSKDPSLGEVDVWFDGAQVVKAVAAKTLNDDNPHFTQVGLLRGVDPFSDMPVIVIDDAVEGDNLADVHPEPPSMGEGGGGSGGTATSASGGGGAGAATGSGGSGGSAAGGDNSGGNPATPPPTEDSSGCSVGQAKTTSSDATDGVLGAFGLLAVASVLRRRRSHTAWR